MNNPLNELSAVYSQSIAEGCGCDEKKKDKKAEMMPQGDTPMGGDGARSGKNKKGYVEPMGEGYDKPDEKLKTDRVGYRIPKKDADAAKERLLAKAKKKREMKQEDIYSNWREEWEFIGEYNLPNYATGDSEKNIENPKPKTQSRSSEKITEKNVKNVIKINPPQGMGECFAEIGGVITEMYEIELDEKIDIEKADMGEVIKDFRKSDAPQFKGKSKKKKQQMAIAAKLEADDEGGMMGEETEEEKKKRELMARTKEHDDKHDGKLAESDFPKDAPSIKDAKKATETYVKRYPGLGYAPTIKQEMKEGRVLAGVISTIRSKNGMDKISMKGKDKLQDKKEKSMCEDTLDEVAPLAAIPAILAKGAAITGKLAAKGAVAAGKVGVKATKDSLKQSYKTLTTNEEMSIDKQMELSREFNKKRNPNPDHRAIRAKQMKNSTAPKDTRSPAEKMADAYASPRKGPGGATKAD